MLQTPHYMLRSTSYTYNTTRPPTLKTTVTYISSHFINRNKASNIPCSCSTGCRIHNGIILVVLLPFPFVLPGVVVHYRPDPSEGLRILYHDHCGIYTLRVGSEDHLQISALRISFPKLAENQPPKLAPAHIPQGP